MTTLPSLNKLVGRDNVGTWKLREMGNALIKMADEAGRLYVDGGKVDERLNRVHLMLEEMGELVHGMYDFDEIETLDAVGDVLFTVYGTAVKLGLPAKEALAEVTRSNLTKVAGRDLHAEGRGSEMKGADFSPTNMEDVLERFRYGP